MRSPARTPATSHAASARTSANDGWRSARPPARPRWWAVRDGRRQLVEVGQAWSATTSLTGPRGSADAASSGRPSPPVTVDVDREARRRHGRRQQGDLGRVVGRREVGDAGDPEAGRGRARRRRGRAATGGTSARSRRRARSSGRSGDPSPSRSTPSGASSSIPGGLERGRAEHPHRPGRVLHPDRPVADERVEAATVERTAHRLVVADGAQPAVAVAGGGDAQGSGRSPAASVTCGGPRRSSDGRRPSPAGGCGGRGGRAARRRRRRRRSTSAPGTRRPTWRDHPTLAPAPTRPRIERRPLDHRRRAARSTRTPPGRQLGQHGVGVGAERLRRPRARGPGAGRPAPSHRHRRPGGPAHAAATAAIATSSSHPPAGEPPVEHDDGRGAGRSADRRRRRRRTTGRPSRATGHETAGDGGVVPERAAARRRPATVARDRDPHHRPPARPRPRRRCRAGPAPAGRDASITTSARAGPAPQAPADRPVGQVEGHRLLAGVQQVEERARARRAPSGRRRALDLDHPGPSARQHVTAQRAGPQRRQVDDDGRRPGRTGRRRRRRGGDDGARAAAGRSRRPRRRRGRGRPPVATSSPLERASHRGPARALGTEPGRHHLDVVGPGQGHGDPTVGGRQQFARATAGAPALRGSDSAIGGPLAEQGQGVELHGADPARPSPPPAPPPSPSSPARARRGHRRGAACRSGQRHRPARRPASRSSSGRPSAEESILRPHGWPIVGRADGTVPSMATPPTGPVASRRCERGRPSSPTKRRCRRRTAAAARRAR